MKTIKYFDNFLNEAKYTNADFSTTARKWFNRFLRIQKDLILQDLDDNLLSRIETIAIEFNKASGEKLAEVENFFRRSGKLRSSQGIVGSAELIFWDGTEMLKKLEEFFIPITDYGFRITFSPNFSFELILGEESFGMEGMQICNVPDSPITKRNSDFEEFLEDFLKASFDLIEFYDLPQLHIVCLNSLCFVLNQNQQIYLHSENRFVEFDELKENLFEVLTEPWSVRTIPTVPIAPNPKIPYFTLAIPRRIQFLK